MARPARISRTAIAEAAHEIGLEELTLKAVAERLGVGVPSLYHHIGGREDLLQLAAEQAVRRLHLPDDHGQHWAVWLLEWAVYNRDAFVAQPGLLVRFLTGGIDPELVRRSAEGIRAVLERQGFDPAEAYEAYQLISTAALGEALAVLRDRTVEREHDPLPFEDRVATALIGIAARRGDRWEEIAALLGVTPA